jgi:hypothetical protein
MNIPDLITQSKQATEEAKSQLLKTLGFVPEDKPTWSPSSTARSAVQIVSHCGMANQAFATLLRGEPLALPSDPEEAARVIREAGKDIATREAAVKMLEESTAEVLAALDTVTEERAATSPNSPFGPLPFSVWMQVPGMHMGGHARQIDYLQTIWGDQQDH